MLGRLRKKRDEDMDIKTAGFRKCAYIQTCIFLFYKDQDPLVLFSELDSPSFSHFKELPIQKIPILLTSNKDHLCKNYSKM